MAPVYQVYEKMGLSEGAAFMDQRIVNDTVTHFKRIHWSQILCFSSAQTVFLSVK
jgi:hypothetical protein